MRQNQSYPSCPNSHILQPPHPEDRRGEFFAFSLRVRANRARDNRTLDKPIENAKNLTMDSREKSRHKRRLLMQAKKRTQDMSSLHSDEIYNVLFLCTGNSARSIIAEALLNRLGKDRFQAYSAGSDPKGEVHPVSLSLLEDMNYATDFARSKSWHEFSQPNGSKIDFVFYRLRQCCI